AAPALDRHRACVRLNDAVEDAHERGFSRPILADERMNLAGHDVEADVMERHRGTKALGYVAGADRGRERARRHSAHRATRATCIFSSANRPRSMTTSLSSVTVQSRIGTS